MRGLNMKSQRSLIRTVNINIFLQNSKKSNPKHPSTCFFVNEIPILVIIFFKYLRGSEEIIQELTIPFKSWGKLEYAPCAFTEVLKECHKEGFQLFVSQ